MVDAKYNDIRVVAPTIKVEIPSRGRGQNRKRAIPRGGVQRTTTPR